MDAAELAWIANVAGTEGEIAEPLPIEVAPDWQEQLAVGEAMARLIDRHLDYEEESAWAGPQMTPARLCPAQRVALATDCFAVAVEGRR